MVVIDDFPQVRCCSRHFAESILFKYIPVKQKLSLLHNEEAETWWDQTLTCQYFLPHLDGPRTRVNFKHPGSRTPLQVGTQGMCHQSVSHFSLLEQCYYQVRGLPATDPNSTVFLTLSHGAKHHLV